MVSFRDILKQSIVKAFALTFQDVTQKSWEDSILKKLGKKIGRVYGAKPLADSRGKAHKAPVVLRHIIIVSIRVSTRLKTRLKNTTLSFLRSPALLKSANSNCPTLPLRGKDHITLDFLKSFSLWTI